MTTLENTTTSNVAAAPEMDSVSNTNNNNNNEHQQQDDERLTRAVRLVRQLSSPNLKEQCLRTEWASLQTDLERDLLVQVVSERTFWDDVKDTARDDLEESADANDDEVDIDSRMLQMFKIFDKDGSGAIDANELQQMLLYMGVPMAEGEVKEMIAQVDSDLDGAINDQEFLHVMKHVLPQKTQGGAAGGKDNQSATSSVQRSQGAGVQPTLTAASLANAQRNVDAQKQIRSANQEKDELASRASEAGIE